jgi:hypothetical protein
MAYEIKYSITAATKGDTETKVYLYEDGYEGDIIDYPCTGIQLQYIPRSDDIFEPIYVSQLDLTLDVTDDVDNMPDFTTLNDRKYFVRVYIDESLQWQGWAISDNVQFSFSTGRKELSFNAIDGLGMLERIPFSFPINYTLIGLNTLNYYLAGSLGQLQYPLTYNIVSGISFFAEGMDNRTDAAINDPLNQTYINYATFVNNEQVPNNCLDIITQIARGFGARLFQSKGDFYIVPLTELAQETYYSTIYNSLGVPTSAATQSLTGNIEGYTDNTSGLYFVDNSQFKIIRKGYNKIRLSKDVSYPKNWITNWDLKLYEHISPTEDDVYSWTELRNGANIYVKNNPTQKYNSFIIGVALDPPYVASVSPNNMPKIGQNEVMNIGFNINGINSPVSGPEALFILKVEVTNGTETYFYRFDDRWILNTLPLEYYYEPFDGSNPKANVSLSLPPSPITGDITIELILNGGSTYWKYTEGAVIADNFSLEIVPSFASFITDSFITDTEEYVYNIDLPFGFNDITDGYFTYRGFLSDSTGLNLKNWYRQEYQDQTYRSLSELVVKQYSNCLNKNIINLDCSFMGIETADGRFNASMRITADDIDPTQISVETKTFILGNSTIDYPNNVVTATLLDVNSENIETTLSTIYNTNTLRNTTPVGYGHFRSTGFLTREAAYAAPLTENIIYLENAGFPSIGDVYYEDENLNIPFNGAQLWWKVMTTEVTFSAFKISSSGGIMEIYL